MKHYRYSDRPDLDPEKAELWNRKYLETIKELGELEDKLTIEERKKLYELSGTQDYLFGIPEEQIFRKDDRPVKRNP